MHRTWIPLFPLNVVLFPTSSLPLHIFEERYKTLINECLAQGSEFGINLTQDSGMADIGCLARVRTLLRRYDDGRLDIVVQGTRRYRLVSRDDGRAPYLVGAVEMLADPSEQVDTELAAETVQLYNTLLALIRRDDLPFVDMNRSGPGLSFLIAQKAGLDLDQRQQLLEILGENNRLRILHDYLHELIPRLQGQEEIERIVRNDGYL